MAYPSLSVSRGPPLDTAMRTHSDAWATGVLRRARALADKGENLAFVISTDAHHTSELDRMQWGAKHALRGWVDKRRVANTWSAARFASWSAAKKHA